MREKQLADKEELRAMFGDIELIYGINKAILADIMEAVEKWDSTQMIGNVFLRFAPFLKMYFVYVKVFLFFCFPHKAEFFRHLGKIQKIFSDK